MGMMVMLAGKLFSQNVSMAYVDHKFVDKSGIPVTGDYSFKNPQSDLNADVSFTYGVMNGHAIYYFQTGEVKEIAHFKDGMKNGLVQRFNEKGDLVMEANYYEGMKSGVWKIWDDNGCLRMKIRYSDDNKTGLWKSWNEKGELTQKKWYGIK